MLGTGHNVGTSVAVEIGNDHLIGTAPVVLQQMPRPAAFRIAVARHVAISLIIYHDQHDIGPVRREANEATEHKKTRKGQIRKSCHYVCLIHRRSTLLLRGFPEHRISVNRIFQQYRTLTQFASRPKASAHCPGHGRGWRKSEIPCVLKRD